MSIDQRRNEELFGAQPSFGPEPSHAEVLARAAEQAEANNLKDILVVDVDYHHTEPNVWPEILEYIDNDVIRHMFKDAGGYAAGGFSLPGQVEFLGQEAYGRIQPQRAYDESQRELTGMTGAETDVAMARETMELMGSDYVSIFPTYLLDIGTNPYPHLEAPVMHAWSRWITERVLSEEPGIIAQLPLPFHDPEACMRMVEDFGECQGVVGFMVTSIRYDQNYKGKYFDLYRMLEERGFPLSFHSGTTFRDRITQFNKFISVHAIGFPLFHLVQATNWVVNGVPELFPGLKTIFIEGGLSWVPFLMQRLDHEFLRRPSDAPLLKRPPSEYLKEFFYATQPFEAIHQGLLQETFEMLDAETQLLYASDWPHWDWDPPRAILDLDFLDDGAKHNILGLNAAKLFDLDPTKRR